MMISKLASSLYKALQLFTACLGRILSYLLFVMMLLTGLVVLLRYVVQYGNIIYLQELISYLHSATFLLAIAWGLRSDVHVRVDIFYRAMMPSNKAWVNAIGGLVFLLPLSIFLCLVSFDYAMQSWAIKEVSSDAGGIEFVYGLKMLIPISFFLVALEALSQVICNALQICLDNHPLHTAQEARRDAGVKAL